MRHRIILITLCLLASAAAVTRGEASSETTGRAIPRSNVAGKKLIRMGREIRNIAKGSSMADINLPEKVRIWQRTGLDGLVFNIYTHKNPNADRKSVV